jgi:hypothetical protein
MWARPGDQNSPTQATPQAGHPHQPTAPPAYPPPPAQEYPATAPFEHQAPLQDAAEPVKPKRRFRFRGDPVSIILVLVIVAALSIAGLVGGELYARNRANTVVAPPHRSARAQSCCST